MLKTVVRLEKWLAETEKVSRGRSSIGLHFGSLSEFPVLFIFLSIIGLQNNWILSRNFNALSTCDSNEGDISALPNCENENAI